MKSGSDSELNVGKVVQRRKANAYTQCRIFMFLTLLLGREYRHFVMGSIDSKLTGRKSRALLIFSRGIRQQRLNLPDHFRDIR